MFIKDLKGDLIMEHRYVVHVFEGQYGGSSGIEEYYFTKLDDLKDVEDEAITASVDLMMSYSFIADTLEDEDVDIFENVAYTIYEILNDGAFRFDYLTYKNYHKRLFKNLDKKTYNPGEFRTYNFTKPEPILNDDTVEYQSYDLIEETLKYDFSEEKEINYFHMTQEQLINRISEFTSRIWQVHPFQEGNTRTTAIFIQKYLLSIGFKVNNDLFKDNSLYFRNALVRANYTNYSKGIKANNKYLNMFFENLLLNKNNKLNNEDLKIK